jgi:2-C-methyl-D-erythritol 4-phosphate cytidylyltransferase
MRASAIVVAAGNGVRLCASTAKAFVPIGGATMLARTLRTVGAVRSLREVVLTVPIGMEQVARIAAAEVGLPLKIIAGGARRQDSVRIALELTSAEAELVVVHDVARPFATVAMFEAALERAAEVGAAIVASPLADTLKRVADDTIDATLPPANLWLAQTPQAFRRRLLKQAHDAALNAGITTTDDAELVERIGATVAIVAGSSMNLKITTLDDLHIAEAIVAAKVISGPS